MEGKLTVETVIEMTAGQLERIQVPLSALEAMPKGFAEYLGREIAGAIRNLRACTEAIRKSEEERAAAEEAPDAVPEAEESEVSEDE